MNAELAPASVLDASALIALLHDEPGAQTVVEAINEGAAVSAFNWAEVLSKVAHDGTDPVRIAKGFAIGSGTDALVHLDGPSADDCIEIARLRPLIHSLGLSLADRACLVLARRLGVPAITGDRIWAKADVGVTVRLIR